MNTPTKITVARMVLIPVFVALFFMTFIPYNRFFAVAVFAIACFTDFLDGYLARKNNQVTTLGKFLDPIADKLLVSCALIAICLDLTSPSLMQISVAICAMIILCREIMVSCFRIIAATKNTVLAADKLGKIKTILQMFALLILIPFGTAFAPDIYGFFNKAPDGISYPNLTGFEQAAQVFYLIGFALLIAATVMTIISGLNYVLKNKIVFKDDKKE